MTMRVPRDTETDALPPPSPPLTVVEWDATVQSDGSHTDARRRRRSRSRSSSSSSHTSRRRLHFDVEELQRYYHLPLKTAAQRLGVCEAALKRICRRNHIRKWPYRQLQSVKRRLDGTSAVDGPVPPPTDASRNEDNRFLLPHELQVQRQRSRKREVGEQAKQYRLQQERERIIQAAHREKPALSLTTPPPRPSPVAGTTRSPGARSETALAVLASLCSTAPTLSPSSTPTTEHKINTPARILRLMMQR